MSPKASRTSSKFSRKIFALPMHRQDQYAVALPEIEFAQCLADKVGSAPDDAFHQDGFAGSAGFVSQLRFRLENHARHFLDSFHSGHRRFEEQQIARRKAQFVQRRLEPLAIAQDIDDARFAQTHERRLREGLSDERRIATDHRLHQELPRHPAPDQRREGLTTREQFRPIKST